MIGVFDSGLGGLTVLHALIDRLPHEHFIYFGDNAHAPYGTRDYDDIYALTCAGVDRLMKRGCRLVIIACNTASAVALRKLQREWLPKHYPGNRVLGVFVPMVEALSRLPWQADHEPQECGPDNEAEVEEVVGLFATPKTVEHGAFREEIEKRTSGLKVVSQACPGLVDAIEAGADADRLQSLVDGFVAEWRRRAGYLPVHGIILGCTHYPLVADRFRAALGEAVPVLSQPGIVSESLADYLDRHPEFREAGIVQKGTRAIFLTSGDAHHVGNLASRFFGHPVKFSYCV